MLNLVEFITNIFEFIHITGVTLIHKMQEITMKVLNENKMELSS